MSTVLFHPNSDASKVVQPLRKGRYPSKVTNLHTARSKRHDEELAKKRREHAAMNARAIAILLEAEANDKGFLTWLHDYLKVSHEGGGEFELEKYLSEIPRSPGWVESAAVVLRFFGTLPK